MPDRHRRSPLLLVVVLLLLPLHVFAATADALSVVCFGRDGHVDIESSAGHHEPMPAVDPRILAAGTGPIELATPPGDGRVPCVDAALVAPTSPERPPPVSRTIDAAPVTGPDPITVPSSSRAGPPIAPARGPAHLTVVQTTVLRI